MNKKKTIEHLVNGNILVTIPIRLKYDGNKTVIHQPEYECQKLDINHMSPLQKALIQGFQYMEQLESGAVSNISELAIKEKQDRPFLFRALSLVNLAPDIVEAILNGMATEKLTIKNLKKGFPENWHDQREFFAMNDQQQLVTPPRRRGVRMLKKE